MRREVAHFERGGIGGGEGGEGEEEWGGGGGVGGGGGGGRVYRTLAAPRCGRVCQLERGWSAVLRASRGQHGRQPPASSREILAQTVTNTSQIPIEILSWSQGNNFYCLGGTVRAKKEGDYQLPAWPPSFLSTFPQYDTESYKKFNWKTQWYLGWLVLQHTVLINIEHLRLGMLWFRLVGGQ